MSRVARQPASVSLTLACAENHVGPTNQRVLKVEKYHGYAVGQRVDSQFINTGVAPNQHCGQKPRTADNRLIQQGNEDPYLRRLIPRPIGFALTVDIHVATTVRSPASAPQAS